jgi:hypothetical protein
VPYWPPTFSEKKRSMAYLTSLEVTARFTGGPNFTFGLIFTVTDLASSAICGSPSARSGTGCSSPGLKPYSGRPVAKAIW